MYAKRITWRDFPKVATLCKIPYCMYKGATGFCGEPHINAFNSDAKCYQLTPRDRLALLHTATEQTLAADPKDAGEN